LRSLGRVHVARGELGAAEASFAESLELVQTVGDVGALADLLEAWASLRVAAGEPERGLVLLGAGDALRESIEAARAADEPRGYCERLAAASGALPAETVEAALGRGRSLGPEGAASEVS